MLKAALLLTSLLLVMLVSLHAADARDHVSPSPAAEYRFRFDLPAGPEFTEAEKEAQRSMGAQVVPMVRRAFEAGAESVTLAPGDYRFGQET